MTGIGLGKKTIFVKLKGGIKAVDIHKISHFEVNDDYTHIHFRTAEEENEVLVLLMPLIRVEQILEDDSNFMRIHRKYIVNLNFVDQIVGYQLNMKFFESDIALPIAKGRWKLIKSRLLNA